MTSMRLTVMLCASLMSACAQEHSGIDSESIVMLNYQLSSGDASLNCEAACSFRFGWERRHLKNLYHQESWSELARSVQSIGFNDSLAWFYLGRAAEGKNYMKAAQKYYKIALFQSPKCDSVLNNCDVDVPLLAEVRLANLGKDEKISTNEGSELRQTGIYHALPDQNSNMLEGNSVTLVEEGGTFKVPVIVNGVISLNFFVDSGAADVSMPSDVVLTLMRTGTLQERDFLGSQKFVAADGSIIPSPVFRIHSLKVGDRLIENVTGSMTRVEGSLLLGQSFLSRLRRWTMNNNQHILEME